MEAEVPFLALTHCLSAHPSTFLAISIFSSSSEEKRKHASETARSALKEKRKKEREKEEEKEKKTDGSFLQPRKSSKLGLHYSASPGLHDNTANKQELSSDQTATTEGTQLFQTTCEWMLPPTSEPLR